MAGSKGSARFNYSPQQLDKVDYTPRQQAILDGNMALSDMKVAELVKLAKKAAAKEDDFAEEIVQCLLLQKTDPREYFPQISVEEAREILQRLTPWKLDY